MATAPGKCLSRAARTTGRARPEQRAGPSKATYGDLQESLVYVIMRLGFLNILRMIACKTLLMYS
jgi:hypothetical protein